MLLRHLHYFLNMIKAEVIFGFFYCRVAFIDRWMYYSITIQNKGPTAYIDIPLQPKYHQRNKHKCAMVYLYNKHVVSNPQPNFISCL